MNLYDNLIQYSRMGYYPMHMPGHKRNTSLFTMTDPYEIDITEIDGFDNLHHAEGILKEGMKEAAALYGAEYTDYLVGGSTAGILTGISACTKKGDKILVARNSHKSVYHGIYLKELQPVYLYPERMKDFGINGSISPHAVKDMLEKHRDIKLVVITSPTYEGIVSDIKAIADTAHQHGVPLMVDEAHGAHLGFHEGFPQNAVSNGADIVIHSIHKTLPAFTQSALIHTNGKLADYEEIKRYLTIYQSSSPSYILMAGIAQCIRLLKNHKQELFSSYHKQLYRFYETMKQLKHMKLLTKEIVQAAGGFRFDPSKITISVMETSLSGIDLYNLLLEKYKIQLEMISKDYVLGMTSIGDTEEGFKRLTDALLQIDETLLDNPSHEGIAEGDNWKQPEVLLLSHEVYDKPREQILLAESQGRIAGEYLYLYPPGIPLLVPGEKITGEMVSRLMKYKENGLNLSGLQDDEGKYIKVVK